MREIGAGMLVRVRPGERIPVDGVVVEGESHTDEAVITGESRQVDKGRRLHGDCRQHQSRRAAADPRAAAREPQPAGRRSAGRFARRCRRRSPTQRLADRVVGVSVPLVLAARRADGRLLGAVVAVRSGAADRPRGAGGRLSVRGRPRRADGDLARHRPAGAVRLPRPRPRRARGARAHAVARLRQDRHADVGQIASRRHRQRRGRRSTRCSHAPPVWSAIPSMAWRAPSSRRPLRAALEPVATRDVRAVPGRGIRGSADGAAGGGRERRLDARSGLAACAGAGASGRGRWRRAVIR